MAFNHISDISMVTMLPVLEVLDVEGLGQLSSLVQTRPALLVPTQKQPE